jgi:hypothetical protein
MSVDLAFDSSELSIDGELFAKGVHFSEFFCANGYDREVEPLFALCSWIA